MRAGLPRQALPHHRVQGKPVNTLYVANKMKVGPGGGFGGGGSAQRAVRGLCGRARQVALRRHAPHVTGPGVVSMGALRDPCRALLALIWCSACPQTCAVFLSLQLKREMYFAILLDRATAGPVMIGCSEGGTSIEDLAEK